MELTELNFVGDQIFWTLQQTSWILIELTGVRCTVFETVAVETASQTAIRRRAGVGRLVETSWLESEYEWRETEEVVYF